jgi:hypothetical protein
MNKKAPQGFEHSKALLQELPCFLSKKFDNSYAWLGQQYVRRFPSIPFSAVRVRAASSTPRERHQNNQSCAGRSISGSQYRQTHPRASMTTNIAALAGICRLKSTAE